MTGTTRPHKVHVNTSFRAEPETWVALTEAARALGWSINTTLEHAAQVLTGLADPDPRTPLCALLLQRLETMRAIGQHTPAGAASDTSDIDAVVRRAEQAEAEAAHLRDVLALVDAAVHA